MYFLWWSIAHGGYICREDGKWSTNCAKLYCHIGYYLNRNTGKCEIDACSSDIYIEINEEMDKEIEISPENTYVLALNNNSLAVFIDSPIEDMIHYPTFETCTKFCAVRHSSFSYLYINYFKKLNQKINIKVTAVVNSAQIISVKYDSPKISKIQPISTKVINLIQVTEKNYFYSDSYDNYAKIYLGEYNEEIQIIDILNTNTDFFPESHGKVFELVLNKIYFLIANAKTSYIKSYLYNEIRENVKIANGNLTLLYLKKEKNMNLISSLIHYIFWLN